MSLLPNPGVATVKNVAESIIMAQQEVGLGRTIFFIGAGCSVSAGVPAVPAIAQKMVREIATKFRTCDATASALDCYVSLLEKDRIIPCLREGVRYKPGTLLPDSDIDWYKIYDACFEKHFRSPDDVRDLFGRLLKECDSAINWAHLCLGELAAQGYISTTLTTNFDQLVLRGMASAGLLPVVCDGLESLNRLSSSPSHQQLVELHGSRHTYRLRNRPADVAYVRGQPTAISSIIGLFNTATTFVAVGYGGREDGVMDLLIEAARAYPDKNLYWVTYSDDLTRVGDKVRSFLSYSVNSAVVLGQDADHFFIELCTEMGVGAPAAVREPLARYRDILGDLRKSNVQMDDIGAEVLRAGDLLQTLHACEQRFLSKPSDKNLASDIRTLRLRGKIKEAYDAAVEMRARYSDSDVPREVLEEFVTTASIHARDLSEIDLEAAIGVYGEALAACETMSTLMGDEKSIALFSETLRASGAAFITNGQFEQAKEQYLRALELDKSVSEKKRDDPESLAALAYSYQSLGEALTRSGDLAGAVENFDISLNVRRQIVDLSPGEILPQQNLSMIYDRLGDAKKAQGDLPAAQANYELALQVDERIASEEPGDIGLQRYLAISNMKIGDVLAAREEFDGALERYESALHISEQLMADNPNLVEYKSDLSALHNRIGDVAQERNQFEVALGHYQAALSMSRELVAADPGNAVAHLDVSASLSRLGRLEVDQRNFDAARRYMEEYLAIAERTALRDRSYGSHRRDLALGQQWLGEICEKTGDLIGARRHRSLALKACEEHARANPGSADVQRDYSVALERLGDLEEQTGDLTKALSLYERSRTIAERLVADNPDNPRLGQDLLVTRVRIDQIRDRLSHQGNTRDD
jgi:tetratricopeptide (TPR) repeat protein